MPWIDDVSYAKMLDENAVLKEQNKVLAEKLEKIIQRGRDLQASMAVLLSAQCPGVITRCVETVEEREARRRAQHEEWAETEALELSQKRALAERLKLGQ